MAESGWGQASNSTREKFTEYGLDINAVCAVVGKSDSDRDRKTIDLIVAIFIRNKTSPKLVASWYVGELLTGVRHSVLVRGMEKYIAKAYIEEFLNAGG